MSDASDRFLTAIEQLEHVADEATADEARAAFDEATLQVFWRSWPHVSSWAGALWRRLNEDIESASVPHTESGAPETGGEGG